MIPRLDDVVATHLTPGGGAVVAVIASGDVATTSVGGVPPEARFLLYSVTKTLVAAGLLRLVAAGRLELDGAMATLLPEFPVAARVTLRQLLQHRSGLPDYGGLAAYHDAVRSGATPWREAEFIERTEAFRLRFAPGQGWAYSNIGYMLLRRVLERAGGDDMATVLRRELFAPLGATSASVPVEQADLAGFTFGPSAIFGGALVAERYHPGWIATGVVGASVADAARLVHGIFTTALLPAALRDAMHDAMPVGGPFPGRPCRRPGYGLGLMVEMSEETGPVWGHTGGGPGCTPAVYHFPRHDPPRTVAVATDGEDQGEAETIAWAIAAHC
jgi:D-alanyl-D-alanine carboxypeptidase